MKFLLFFLLYLPVAYSKDCGKSVDLNKTEPLKDMQMLDQDGAGLCWGFTGAQLIEYEMRLKGTKLPVSPLGLAVKSGEGIVTFMDRPDLEGGFVSDVMDAAKSNGVLHRSCVENAVKRFTKNTTMTSSQFTKFLELVLKNYKWKFFDSDKYDHIKNALEKRKSSGDVGNEMDHLRGCEYDVALKSLLEMGKLGSSVTTILNKLLIECEPRDVYDFDYQEHNRGKNDDDDSRMMLHLDYQLVQKKPAAVYLCASALKKDNSVNYRKLDSKKCGNHVLLAVGKRSNNGTCEYLLRNSWGSHWSPPGVSCAFRTPDGKYYPDNSAFSAIFQKANEKESAVLEEMYSKRTVVGCWFPSDNILKNTFGIGGVK